MKKKLFVFGTFIAMVLSISLTLGGCAADDNDAESPDSGQTFPALTQSLAEMIDSDGVNGEFMFSPDGKTIVFAGIRSGSVPGPDNSPSFDLWISRYIDGAWEAPINLGENIDPKLGPNVNTTDNDLEPSFSNDGNALYFTRFVENVGELFVAQKINGLWQAPRNWNDVPGLPPLNTPTGDEHCPIIVSDSLIYFSYELAGVTQASDLWKVEKKDGVWQTPQSLGTKINSTDRDHLHWTGLSKDGKSLIFVSQRTDLDSKGKSDMWISHQDQNGEWQEPINLGLPVNTSGSEVCWVFWGDGKTYVGARDNKLEWVPLEDIPLLKTVVGCGLPPNLTVQ
jgi:hypothetical protein